MKLSNYFSVHHDAETSDPRFSNVVDDVIAWCVHESPPRNVFSIHVKNWFDHKWLRFSGNGLVPFDYGQLRTNHPGVAKKAFWQEHLTFPAFTPKRILVERAWTRRGTSFEKISWKEFEPIHPRVVRGSNHNLQRRVADHADDALFCWYSSNTRSNQRGSIMMYRVQHEECEVWYAGLVVRNGAWRLDATRGIDAETFKRYLTVPLHHYMDGGRQSHW